MSTLFSLDAFYIFSYRKFTLLCFVYRGKNLDHAFIEIHRASPYYAKTLSCYEGSDSDQKFVGKKHSCRTDSTCFDMFISSLIRSKKCHFHLVTSPRRKVIIRNIEREKRIACAARWWG